MGEQFGRSVKSGTFCPKDTVVFRSVRQRNVPLQCETIDELSAVRRRVYEYLANVDCQATISHTVDYSIRGALQLAATYR